MHHKALIFDFFGVICADIAPTWFKKHIHTADPLALKTQYLSPADKGDISEDTLFLELSRLSSIPSQDIQNEWVSSAQINQEMVLLLKQLKDKYKLGLLTNATTPLFPVVLKQHNLEELFDTIAISSDIHYVKPEPEAYQYILQKLNVQSQEALMIDGTPRNVEGAKEIGMGGILFQSCEQLRTDLGI